MTDLLPPSATGQERALVSVSELLENLPVIYRQLWNPDNCPVELLPYLAWSFSLDSWNDDWPEHIKRQAVRDGLYHHRIKGSRKAVENAIERFGITSVIEEWWEKTPKGEPHTFSVTTSAQDNERQLPVYEAISQQWVYCSQAIPVQTSRVYKIRFKVRQTVDDSVNGYVLVGVVTLDDQFKNINSGVGIHRYCAVPGQTITEADGWLVFEGEITGEGNSHNQFRPGTAYIRPMFVLNANGGNGTTQVAELECWDLFENKQMISNPHFDNEKQGWSTEYESEIVSDNAPGTITTAAFRPSADLQTDIINAINQAKPLRSDFDFTVGTVHSGSLHLNAEVRQVILSRETWE